MWIYVLEQPIVGTTDVIIKYCSLNNANLTNFANTNNIYGNINGRFPLFDINGLTEIYSVVIENNGKWVDIGQYFKLKADAVAFVTKYSTIYKTQKFKVDTIQVI